MKNKLYPGDQVRALPSHPFYEDIKNDQMFIVAVELKPDRSGYKYQTASGTSKGFSSLAWENWKTGWREEDLELITSTTSVTVETPATTPPVTSTAKTAAKAAEQAANKVINA